MTHCDSGLVKPQQHKLDLGHSEDEWLMLVYLQQGSFWVSVMTRVSICMFFFLKPYFTDSGVVTIDAFAQNCMTKEI